MIDKSIVVERMEDVPLRATKRATARKSVKLSIVEVMDMLAGYQMSEHAVVDFKEDSGKCLICGKKTNSVKRCICYECHKTHMKKIYEKAREAIKNGIDTITYEF